MTFDPYQSQHQMHAAFNPYAGLNNPFSSPYNAMQTSAINPLAANAGGANFGISPQQLQLASALASQSAQLGGLSPFTNAWQSPFATGFQQNPYAAAVLQNPLLNALSNPVVAQLAAAIGQQMGGQQIGGQQGFSPYGQQYQQQPYQQQPYQQQAYQQQPYQQQPFQQMGFAGQLAPQSWVGQGIAGQQGQFGGGQGQIHPLLLQAVVRAAQTQGISPWGF